MRATAICVVSVCLACAALSAQAPAGAPGFTITLDGDIFAKQTFAVKPLAQTYTNVRWVSTDPRADRLSIRSDIQTGKPEMQFFVPARVGPYVFDRSDEDREDRNRSMAFYLYFHEPGKPGPLIFGVDHVVVELTRMDEPGGRLEGTVKGTVTVCALSGRETGSCRESTTVAVTGSFSVVRMKDRRGD